MRCKLPLFFVVMALVAVTGQNLFAASSTVGSCAGAGIHYTAIQLAVNAASTSGPSTINVCPGTYPEQVTINGYSNLTLIGVKSGTTDAAVVVVPNGGVTANTTELGDGDPAAVQILVENSSEVTISHISVDGSNNGLSGGCGTDLVGIYYKNSGGTITDDALRYQELDQADFGCQQGLAILDESSTGTPAITISNNSVHDYDKNGITVDGPGTGNGGPAATVKGNTVIGIGATSLIAQNGIQIGFGATGTVSGNYVADDVYTGADYGSSGILVYASSGITVQANIVEGTQLGVATASDSAYGSADSTQVLSNHIGGTKNFDAIDLCSNSNTAKGNLIYSASESGIHLDDECSNAATGNTVSGNTISEACAGVLLGPNTASSVGSNTFLNDENTTYPGDTCPTSYGPQSHAKHRSLRPSPKGK
jgi:parallel beta-helix repeat protein